MGTFWAPSPGGICARWTWSAARWQTGAGPGTDPLTIDVDSTICETYGLQKQGGSRFTYAKVRGYHPLLAVAACRAQRMRFSITVRLSPALHRVIGEIADADWVPIP